MTPSSPGGCVGDGIRLRIQEEDHYGKLCDKNYLKQLEQQIQRRYEKQQEEKEDRLARGELRRERDLMLKGLLSPCADDMLEYDNDMVQDAPTNEKATPGMAKKIRYTGSRGSTTHSPYRKALLSRSTFPSLFNTPNRDDDDEKPLDT